MSASASSAPAARPASPSGSFAPLTRAIGVLLATSSLVACFGDATNTPPSSGEPGLPAAPSATLASDVPTYADFVSRDTALRCQQLAPVCVSFGQRPSYTCDDVLPNLDEQDEPLAPAPAAYSPEGAAACLNERAAAGLSSRLLDRRHGTPGSAIASACDAVFRGPAFATVPLGERCSFDSDCAPLAGGRALCAGYEPDDRVCGGIFEAKVGDRCNDKTTPGPQLVPTATVVCDLDRRLYVRAPTLGEPCVAGQCGAATICLSGLCAAPLANGVACVAATDCVSGRCAAGSCAALGKVGEPCASNGDCTTTICDAGRCGPTYTYRDACE